MADVFFYQPNGTDISPYPFDGALTEATAAEFRTAISVPPATGRVYIRDDQATPHYWKLTIVAGVLVPVDNGTTAPADGMIGTS